MVLLWHTASRLNGKLFVLRKDNIIIYVTTATTSTLGKIYGLRIEINKATTGTITIADAGVTVAVIAASTAAQGKEYYGFNGSVTAVNGSTEDFTLMALNTPR